MLTSTRNDSAKVAILWWDLSSAEGEEEEVENHAADNDTGVAGVITGARVRGQGLRGSYRFARRPPETTHLRAWKLLGHILFNKSLKPQTFAVQSQNTNAAHLSHSCLHDSGELLQPLS